MIRSRLSFGFAGLISASILLAPTAWSQDPGTEAAMQAAQQANMAAMQAAQQANMAAMQAAQQANQDAIQASLVADDSSPRCCGFPLTVSPRFSVKAGPYSRPITVRLTDKAYGAVIYYTTNGWTPTTASRRYAGPITIGSTTTLQAIAVAPNCSSSVVAAATYKFPGSPAAPAPVALPTTPVSGGSYQIALNVAVPLVFTAPVSSETAQVGDAVSLQLAEDLKAGNVVLAPKGTPATGKVIQVDHPAMGGLPGEISFRVESLTLHGTVVPLHALRTLAGKSAVHKARGLAPIPGIGFVAAFMHGQDAQIAAGTPVMATLKAGTVLPAPAS